MCVDGMGFRTLSLVMVLVLVCTLLSLWLVWVRRERDSGIQSTACVRGKGCSIALRQG